MAGTDLSRLNRHPATVPSQRPDRVHERRVRFGQVVRERRAELGLSQEDLAELCGFDRKSISRVETGAFSPSLDRVWRLADSLDLSISDLFADLADPPPKRQRRKRR
jgi:transcriptional regulator with XRE-family HTH domain